MLRLVRAILTAGLEAVPVSAVAGVFGGLNGRFDRVSCLGRLGLEAARRCRPQFMRHEPQVLAVSPDCFDSAHFPLNDRDPPTASPQRYPSTASA